MRNQMIAMPWTRAARVLLIAMSVAFVPLGATVARAEEIWVAPSSQADFGGLEVASNTFWPVTPIGVVRMAWAVPNNLETFQGAKVVLIPGSPGGAANVNVFVCAAQSGNSAAAGCAGPFPQAFTGVANQLVEVEIGPSIASRIGTPGANYLTVLAFTSPTTTTDHIVGLRFAYTPTAPSGAATLGANTFSGTQTAPAFVGSGAGLTNLPIPAGVATLGANTFSGTQTAPAFAGDGSSVSNVNANLLDGLDSTAFALTASAATLGANTFTGTQTINTGNLDLDPSSSTVGNVTKNGSPFLHNFGTQNTFLGVSAGNFTTAGANNTAVGALAMLFNGSGGQNTAFGVAGLGHNTTGINNAATGYASLFANITGNGNTASGAAALHENVNGQSNTAAGNRALFFNTTGSSNVAVGDSAGENATTGSNNIYLGANASGVAGESGAIYLGVPGTQTKTVIAGVRGTTVTSPEMVVVDTAGRLGSAPIPQGGGELLPDSVTAAMVAFNYAGSTSEGGPALDLVCVGCVDASELSFGLIGNGANTFTATQTIDNGNLDLDPSGATAGNITKNGTRFLHNFGTNNTFLGLSAGNFTTTGLGKNVAVGLTALTANTSGDSNTAVGYQALLSNTVGSGNTASGVGALLLNSSGTGNTANGLLGLASNSSGANNTANGYSSLYSNGTGGQNTASGAGALFSNSSGSSNTAIGSSALLNATGSNNVALGSSAGLNSTTGMNNIYIGAGINGVAGESNTMYLGKQSSVNKTFVAGIRGITTGVADAIPVVIDSNGQLGTVSSSIRFKEDIRDMADASRRLLRLRPVTFRYTQAYINGAKPIQYGLIAEEVAEVFPELAVRGADGQVETVHYETLNVLLLNELQQQIRRNEKQEQINDEQQQRMDGQQRRIEALERQLMALLGAR
jgi:hypothetical protein